MSDLLEILTSSDTAIQNRSLDSVCQGLNTSELLSECDQLDHFRRTEDNLYRQVRAPVSYTHLTLPTILLV